MTLTESITAVAIVAAGIALAWPLAPKAFRFGQWLRGKVDR